MKGQLLAALGKLDITEIFKTKGDLKRWSAKRTIGAVIVATACDHAVRVDLTWQVVVLCAIGIAPLCLSFFEK
jgi:hypothetical protein